MCKFRSGHWTRIGEKADGIAWLMDASDAIAVEHPGNAGMEGSQQKEYGTPSTPL
jgi:hypothetical protein